MTTDYYDIHADGFIAQTVNVDMAPLHVRFLAHLPPTAKILDAGCGSGRDAKAFLDQGYEVTAFDGSQEMARRASALLGRSVLHMRFDQMQFDAVFDGVWASASLLHVPRSNLTGIFDRLVCALKPGGICYMSFKVGDGERFRNGRLFNDQTESTLETSLASVPDVELVDLWRTQDRRTGRADEQWLNALVRKSPPR
jgi:SAM-dependent methyltransferase